MRKLTLPFILVVALLWSNVSIGQQPAIPIQKGQRGFRHAAAGKLFFAYDTIPGDPLAAHLYKLSNGLTVYLSVNKTEPRIQTMIAVRAGSKMDPPDATGLAHYLEHLLFK